MHKQQPWLKKVDTKFDVPMGSYDGAEKCELVGSLSSFPNVKSDVDVEVLSQNLNINIGLYRDDGLAISNATPRETDNRKYAEVFFDEAS